MMLDATRDVADGKDQSFAPSTHTHTSIKLGVHRDAARQELASHVAAQLPGVQLDSSWVVLQHRRGHARKHIDTSITHPDLQPHGFFRSKAALLRFLQQLQQQRLPMPGVLNHPGASSAAVAAAIAATLTGMSHTLYVCSKTNVGSSSQQGATQRQQQQQQTQGRKRKSSTHSTGSLGLSSMGLAAAAAAPQESAAPGADDARQTRSRLHQQDQEKQRQLAQPAADKQQQDQQKGGTAASSVQQQQQQQRKRASARLAASPEQQLGGDADTDASDHQQQRKRRKTALQQQAQGQQGRGDSSRASSTGPQPPRLPNGRLHCPKALADLSAIVSAHIPGTALDRQWLIAPPCNGAMRRDAHIVHPSLPPGGFFRSNIAVVSYLTALKPQVQQLGGGMDVPGLVQQQQQQQQQQRRTGGVGGQQQGTGAAAAAAGAAVDPAAIAAAIAEALTAAGGGYRAYNGSSNSGGSSGSSGSSGRAAAAAAVAAAKKRRQEAVSRPATRLQQQQRKRVRTQRYQEQTQQQQAAAKPAAKQQQGQKAPAKQVTQQQQLKQKNQNRAVPGASTNNTKASSSSSNSSAIAVLGPLQLPDGRTPCPKSLKALSAQVSVQLPGAQLDSAWRVYAAVQTPPKLDICIKHPSLPQGHFRSFTGMLTYLAALKPLVQKVGSSVTVPGLTVQNQQGKAGPAGQQQGSSNTAASVAAAVKKALVAAGGGFTWRGAGSTLQQRKAGKAAAARPHPQQQGQQQGQHQGVKQRSRSQKSSTGGQQETELLVWKHPPIDREFDLPRKGSNVLVLGMFFASAAAAQQTHVGMAQHRDRARLLQLQQGLGYKTHSFDRDNTEASAHNGQHVQGNFNSLRGAKDVTLRFPDVKFSAIFLDYFRIPTGYAHEMYKPQLFTQFVPELIRRGAAAPGVAVYVPNNQVLLEQLTKAGAFSGYQELVAIPGDRYPLFAATARAQAAKQLGGVYTNVSESRQLHEGSEFVVMRCFAAQPAPATTAAAAAAAKPAPAATAAAAPADQAPAATAGAAAAKPAPAAATAAAAPR